MKKTIGFYLSALAAVLALVSVFLYGKVPQTNALVIPLLIACAVVGVLGLVIGMKSSIGNLLCVISALLCMGAIGFSIGPMISTVVFAYMGMSPMSMAQGYLVFAGVACAAWLFGVIAAFPGIVKKA